MASIVEHLDGLGLIAPAIGEEAPQLFLRLALGLRHAGRLQRLGAALRGEQPGEIGQLSGLNRDQLIAGLRRLQHADRRLACRDE